MPSKMLGERRRKISLPQAIGYSIALLAPTASMALNTSLAASMAGRAVPLVMFGSLVGVLLMAVPFIKFTRERVHAGSIYGFNSSVLGTSAGFISGWVLLLSYLGFSLGGIGLIGDFGQAVFAQLGYSIPWAIPALIGTIIAYFLVIRDIRVSTNLALILEGLAVLAMIVLSIVILSRGGETGHLTILPFIPGSKGIGGVAFAMVFGFLSYFGFDVAATIGEETENPRRNIPLAIISNLILAGILYVFISYAQTVGFGLAPKDIATFAQSSAPLGYLAAHYMGIPMAVAIDIGALISGFAATMAGIQAASRILFALSRDGVLLPSLGQVHERFGTPFRATTVVTLFGLIIMLIPSPWNSAANMFGYAGTIGVLGFLVSYGLTSISDFIQEFRRRGAWRGLVTGIVSILALVIILVTLYANVFPVPPMPYAVLPYITLAWIIFGAFLLFRKPSLRDDLSRALAAHEEQVSHRIQG
ncbi:MAG: APC family permease [Acidibacillus sp.]|nr:APC family permease [Acidibacillus sp.]